MFSTLSSDEKEKNILMDKGLNFMDKGLNGLHLIVSIKEKFKRNIVLAFWG